jgi:hypothetical protein
MGLRPEVSIGMLDKALDEAQGKGWTVVSMKDRLEAHLRIRVAGRHN